MARLPEGVGRSVMRTVFCFFALALCSAFGVPAQDTPAPLKILTIGNSFADNATEFLGDIGQAENRPILVGRANLGGAPFERHVEAIEAFEKGPETPGSRPYPSNFTPKRDENGKKYSLKELLQAERWDVVTIQQASKDSFRFETFEPYAGQVIAYVKKYAPQAEILIHQTWAYREDYPGFVSGELSPQQMYTGLVSAYRQLAEKYHLRLIPVGDAFQAARQTDAWRFSFPDPQFDYKNPSPDSLPDQTHSLNVGWRWSKNSKTNTPEFGLDFKHANTAGKYLAALVWYETISGAPVSQASFVPKGLEPGPATDLRRLAGIAVKNNPAAVRAP